MKSASIEDFYNETPFVLPESINKEIGHFNVFKIADMMRAVKKGIMPYNRRNYYKISLIRGHNVAEYADKVINVEKNALLFATPKIPYHYIPQDDNQSGYFCIFTSDFLLPAKSGVVLDELPIYQPGGYPVFKITDEQADELSQLFNKMHTELSSEYAYKYDLIRNYVIELIHYGQKLHPTPALRPEHTASARVAALFVELLERQFPIESQQQLVLRTANDYAERLAVHVNHLNKVLKENTGKTTTDIISARIMQEAKILLRETNWNISEIAYVLGYGHVAHFSNAFKKQTSLTPMSFRK